MKDILKVSLSRFLVVNVVFNKVFKVTSGINGCLSQRVTFLKGTCMFVK